MTDAPLTDKLAKFVRLLSSDQDGEVIAAAGAIRRTLLAANLDIHDLARVIEQSKLGDPGRESGPDPTDSYWDFARRAKPGTRWTHDFKEWNEDDPPEDPLNHRRATYCYQFRRTILNGREAEFITDMIAQSLHRRLTPRQAEWLEAIWRKCQPFNFNDLS